MDPVLVVLKFQRVSKLDLYSLGGLCDFLSYDFAIRSLQGYPAERLGLVKHHDVDDRPVAPVLATIVHVNRPPSVAGKTIF